MAPIDKDGVSLLPSRSEHSCFPLRTRTFRPPMLVRTTWRMVWLSNWTGVGTMIGGSGDCGLAVQVPIHRSSSRSPAGASAGAASKPETSSDAVILNSVRRRANAPALPTCAMDRVNLVAKLMEVACGAWPLVVGPQAAGGAGCRNSLRSACAKFCAWFHRTRRSATAYLRTSLASASAMVRLTSSGNIKPCSASRRAARAIEST
jgi:hypothetical protein